MKNKILVGASLAALGLVTVACGSGGVRNAEKPLVFFNRQPSDPTTGAIDHNTMKFSDKTYYVGFDAKGGGAVQGQMILDYLKTKTKAELDKNNDGTLGYVLAIGDQGHNDSKARTEGIRRALGTWNGSTDAGSTKEGEVQVKDGTLKVKEIASKEMKRESETWSSAEATNTMGVWMNTYSAEMDFAVSNNDGMAMGFLQNKPFKDKKIPLFGYDANADALAAIKDGSLTGTVSQNVDLQAATTLQVIRNMLDGVTGDDVIKKGVTEKDKYGNQVTGEVEYRAEDRAILAKNTAVTSENISQYDGKRDPGLKQTDAPKKQVLLTLYNAGDNFLSQSYRPALEYYAKLMNLELNIQAGDGNSEQSVLDKFVNLDKYDAYAINMVRTNSGRDYIDRIKK